MILTLVVAFSVHAQEPEKINGIRGEDVTLTCQLDENDRGARSWLLGSDEGAKLIAFKNQTFLPDINVDLDEKGLYSLQIRGVEQTEDGLWHCQQQNKIKKIFRLSVDVKPYIEPITTNALQAGDDATLICIASGQPRPELTWTFNNRTIDPRETIILEDRNGQQRIQSTLVVNSVKKSSIQSYGCEASNRAGTLAKYADIFIKEPPKIIKENQYGYEETKYSKLSDETLLVCISKGYPNPIITWTAPDNSRISENGENNTKYSVCVKRQNHKKYGQMTIAYLGWGLSLLDCLS